MNQDDNDCIGNLGKDLCNQGFQRNSIIEINIPVDEVNESIIERNIPVDEVNEKSDIFLFFRSKSILINRPYVSIDLFGFSDDIVVNNSNSSHLKIEDLLKNIRLCDDDSKFGDLYAVIGNFYLNNSGFVIVLSGVVAKDIFQSSLICHCVQFSSKTVNEKLRKRITRMTALVIFEEHKVLLESSIDVIITSMTNGPPLIVQPSRHATTYHSYQLGSIWDGMIDPRVEIIKRSDRACLKTIQTRVLVKVRDKSTSSMGNDKSRKPKIDSSLARNYYISECKQNSKQSNSVSDKLNLREETISFGEDMFSIHWSPKKFTDAFNMAKKKSTGEEVLSAVCAGILMDPSFRLDDCEEFDVTDKIGITSVDLDQLIIKFELMCNSSDTVNGHVYSDYDLLSEWYDYLAPLMTSTKNQTTTFSPTSVETNSVRGGASGDSEVERFRHVVLPITGITSEVLNISYKRTRSEVANTDECYEASLIVMHFLFSAEKSIFRNENSIEMLGAAKINWSHKGKQSDESFQVSGGLLFQFLTLFLLSTRGKSPIRISLETYGGKRRGAKVMWKLPNEREIIPSNDLISEVFRRFCSSEESKIAFLLKEIVKGIISNIPAQIKNISTSLGLGCDARGLTLENGNPSFLVCQPTLIEEIEVCRKAKTDKAFTNNDQLQNSIDSADLSKQTRLLAKKCDYNHDNPEDFTSGEEAQEKHTIRTR